MLKSIVEYLPSKIIPMISGFIVTIILGRYLEPSVYGDLALIITTLGILSAILVTPVIQSVFRYYDEYKLDNKSEALIGTGLMLNFGVLILLLLIGGILLGLNILENYAIIYFIGILIICSQSFYQMFINLHRLNNRPSKYSKDIAINSILKLVLLFLFLNLLSKSIELVLLSTLIPLLLIFFYELYRYNKNKNERLSFSKSVVHEIIRYGGPLIGTSIMNLMLSNLDRYMIKYYSNSTELGFYSLGYNLANVSMVSVTMMIMLVVYPLLIKIYNKESKLVVEKKIKKFLNLHFFILIPALFCFFLFSKEIIFLVFPKFTGAEKVIPFVAAGVFLYGTSFYINKAFELSKKTEWIFYSLFISTVANFFLNMFLIPRYKANGAAYATILSYILYFVVLLMVSRQFLSVKFDLNFIARVTGSSVIFAGIVTFLNRYYFFDLSIVNLLLKILLVFIIYFIMSIVTGIFKEIKVILEINSNLG